MERYRRRERDLVDPGSEDEDAATSTLLNESGRWHPDAIERQLAHVESDGVRRAYARGEYWDERVRKMQDACLGTASAGCNIATGPATARCVALDGREQTYAPEFTLSAGAQYAIPLGEDLTLTARVDFARTGAVWTTLFQNRALSDRLPQRDILNAQLTLATGPWSIGGFATKLTDEHNVAALNGLPRLAGAPRQYGVRVSRSF